MEIKGDSAVIRAPAKVNLFIDILGKRDDGYHEIATVMQAVSLFDTLNISRRSTGIEVTCKGAPSGEANIAWRAAERMLALVPGGGGVSIDIEKNIPVGRGLGGGSSDAAAVIIAMNSLWGGAVPAEAMHDVAASIGSDVPFFLHGGTALCLGRGERIEPVMTDMKMYFVILSPPVHVATRHVYEQGGWRKFSVEALTNSKSRYTYMVNGLQRGDFSAVAGALCNGFTETVLRLFPGLSVANTHFIPRFRAADMTGTGSAFFGLCESREEAREIAARIEGGLGDVYVVESLHSQG